MIATFLIPIVFFCAFIPEENHECNGQTAIFKRELSPIIRDESTGIDITINTPLTCLKAGWNEVAKQVEQFHKEHPNKELEFRVICKRTEEKI